MAELKSYVPFPLALDGLTDLMHVCPLLKMLAKGVLKFNSRRISTTLYKITKRYFHAVYEMVGDPFANVSHVEQHYRQSAPAISRCRCSFLHTQKKSAGCRTHRTIESCKNFPLYFYKLIPDSLLFSYFRLHHFLWRSCGATIS